ncbi:hypothetical protein KC345_g8972 [Hortaea werneckii]|nr:hypothetical protein KC345_g8972 [Hortaea werneckii]
MFTRYATAALGLCAGASAAPLADLAKRQGQNIDVTVLQFALTLEHLENVFYRQAVNKFDEHDFEKAGFSKDYYNNLKYIAYDEQQHVQLLSDALSAAGVTTVQECTYNFPYEDARGFVTLSSVLEGVGTSAYLGGAPLITSDQYLTTAGSILAVEALHTSYQRNALNKVPFANPLYTSLDPTSVFSIAAMFIDQCPSDNPSLPFTAYPALTVKGDTCNCEQDSCKDHQYKKREPGLLGDGGLLSDGGLLGKDGLVDELLGHNDDLMQCSPPMAGATVSFNAATSDQASLPADPYLTFVSGLSVTSVKAQVDGSTVSAAIPDIAMGQTYVFVSSSDVEGSLDNSQVVFGPAVLEVAPPKPALNYH